MSDHVDDLTWERLAMNELTPGERAATLRHVTSCKACTAIYKGVLALEARARAAGMQGLPPVVADPAAGVQPAEDPLPVAARRPRARRWRWAAAGGAIAVAAAAILLWAKTRGPDPGPGAGVVRGSGHATVELIPPRGTPPALDWRPVAGATGYRVSVFLEDGRPVFARDARTPPLAWPADAAAAPGAYRWKVEALGDAGVIAGSSLQAFRIPP